MRMPSLRVLAPSSVCLAAEELVDAPMAASRGRAARRPSMRASRNLVDHASKKRDAHPEEIRCWRRRHSKGKTPEPREQARR